MHNFFSLESNSEPFKIFSLEHNMILSSLIIVIFGFLLFRKQLKKEIVNKYARYSMALLLFIVEGSLNIWRLAVGEWSIQTSLPFHLCGIAIICSIIMLLRKSYLLFELTYFWGLIGALCAMITPDINVTYTHYRFWQFFLGHELIILAVMFMLIVEGFRPTFQSVKKTFIITNLYMGLMGFFNAITGANYLYLCEKPVASSPTPFDFIGPWPWYILSLELLALTTFLIYYLPYAIKDFFSRRKRKDFHLGV